MVSTIHWISLSEAARRLGLSETHVRWLADRGRLRAVRSAYGRLFDPDDVERFARERAARRRRSES